MSIARFSSSPTKKSSSLPPIKDAEALRLAELGDRLLEEAEALRQTAYIVHGISYGSSPSRARLESKRRITAVWISLAHCVRELSTPSPSNPGHAKPRLVVRRRRVLEPAGKVTR